MGPSGGGLLSLPAPYCAIYFSKPFPIWPASSPANSKSQKISIKTREWNDVNMEYPRQTRAVWQCDCVRCEEGVRVGHLCVCSPQPSRSPAPAAEVWLWPGSAGSKARAAA